MKKKLFTKKTQTIDTFVNMQELAVNLNSSIYNLYVGYLRQPISHELVIGSNYIIHGICSLNKENCSYMVSPLSQKNCSDCEIYKERFNENRKS